MHTFATAQRSACPGFDIHAEQVTLQGRELRACYDNLLLLGIETQHLFNQPFAFGQLAELLAACVVQVEVAEAVFLALVDKLAAVPGQENNRFLRFYILVVFLFKKSSHQVACLGVILAELGMILVAVQFYQVEALFIRRPADIGKIAVGRVSGIEIDAFSGSRVIDAHFHLVAGHSRHRVTDVVDFGNGSGDVNQRILGHHAFVHAVESEQIARRTPEGPFFDSEFSAVDSLAAYDALRFVGYGFVVYIKIIADGIGHMPRFGLIISVDAFFGNWARTDNLAVVEIVNDVFVRQTDQHQAFLRPWEADIVEVLEFTVVAGF